MKPGSTIASEVTAEVPSARTAPLGAGLPSEPPARATRAVARRITRDWPVPLWFIALAPIAISANLLAGVTAAATVELMGGISVFARHARDLQLDLLHYYQAVVYPAATAIITAYLWPVLQHFRGGADRPASALVQRRVVSGPLVVALVGFIPWFALVIVFPPLTVLHFGYWPLDLASQQIWSPLVNGFLAATTAYLLMDRLFRAMVVPRVFPHGGSAEVPGTFKLGVRGRLFIFLLAVAFVPLFTVLGLVRGTAARLDAGLPVEHVVPALVDATQVIFVVFVALGIGFTLMLAQSLTRPLGALAAALRRVQAGDVDVSVRATASDEVGVLEDGANSMVATLREKERILQTFGRVVEPSVRDRLLAGDLRLGGELRPASVLFCDLRGFTALAERTPPDVVVATLNQFFTVMTRWVREHGAFVDKFIGDAMMVVFGLFGAAGEGDEASSAAAAVHCALGMRLRLAELNRERSAAGQVPLAISVSIHTGEVLAGKIGAADRHEYTVIGDTVNVAARLQQLGKEHGHDLVISERTYELARSAGADCRVTMTDEVTLRGRREPIRVFGLA